MPAPPAFQNVAIIGVGLIGGSIGMAVRQRGLAKRVIGIGRRETSLEEALSVGAADEVTTDVAAGVSEADFVLIATPVSKIVAMAEAVTAARPDVLISDAGSTKAEICGALAGARFVGSHPMAGDHRTGCAHARADLLEDRLVIVTTTANNSPEDIERVRQFWQSLGAKVETMRPDEHDAVVAAVSHVPHLVAAALAGTTPEDLLPYSGQGWQDTTRVAAGDPQLWLDILASNRQNVVEQLAAMDQAVREMKRALEAEDYDKLQQILQEAKRKRDVVGS